MAQQETQRKESNPQDVQKQFEEMSTFKLRQTAEEEYEIEDAFMMDRDELINALRSRAHA